MITKQILKTNCIRTITDQVNLLKQAMSDEGINFFHSIKPHLAGLIITMTEIEILQKPSDPKNWKHIIHPNFESRHVFCFDGDDEKESLSRLQESIVLVDMMFFKVKETIYHINPFGEPIPITKKSQKRLT